MILLALLFLMRVSRTRSSTPLTIWYRMLLLMAKNDPHARLFLNGGGGLKFSPASSLFSWKRAKVSAYPISPDPTPTQKNCPAFTSGTIPLCFMENCIPICEAWDGREFKNPASPADGVKILRGLRSQTKKKLPASY